MALPSKDIVPYIDIIIIITTIIFIYSPIANTFGIKAECFFNLTGRGV
jgi:biopolymer transport protein ExbD